MMICISRQGIDELPKPVEVAEVDALDRGEHERDAATERMANVDRHRQCLVADASRVGGGTEEPQRVGEPAQAHDPRILAEPNEVLEAAIRFEIADDRFEVDPRPIEATIPERPDAEQVLALHLQHTVGRAHRT